MFEIFLEEVYGISSDYFDNHEGDFDLLEITERYTEWLDNQPPIEERAWLRENQITEKD